jgi:CHAT domain-containing protein
MRSPRWLAALLLAALASAQVPGAPRAEPGEACGEPAAATGGLPGPAAEGAAAKALARGHDLAALGDAGAALEAFRESGRLARGEGEERLATLAAASEGRAALEAGALDAVEPALERAVAGLDAFPDGATRARLLIHVARTWIGVADRSPARSGSLRRAARLLDRAARTAREAGDGRDESFALGYLGGLYERRGRGNEALELTRRALLAGLEADAPDALYRWHWQAGRIHRANGRADQALDAYRQASRTLVELRQQVALAGAGPDDPLGAGTGDLYLELVDLLLTRAGGTPEGAERQGLLLEALQTLEDQKADELRDYFHDECLMAQREAATASIPGAVVVYPILLPDRIELVLGGSGGLERHVTRIDRETLTAEVRAFRLTLARRTSREYMPHAFTLYDWLIRPLEPSLQQREPETLVFVPGGPLRTIPFAALRDREEKAFLVEKYPVAVVPSLTLTEPRPIRRGSVRMLAAGISESVAGFSPLVNVTGEIEAVQESFPSETLVNAEFQVERFVDEVESRPFGIVHIASHAEFADDPSQSFLLAYDGKISMERLSEVVATTRFRAEQPLELLTLSACETAAGNDRAALGLAGIALRAGARSALATLWSVNDQAAAELVSAFYDRLGEPDRSRAQALQAAQLELLAQRSYRHPAYWSPFILISSWL